MYKLFFHPSECEGAAADFIPFYEKGLFHLFYLYDHRQIEKYGNGVSWYHLVTKNFVKFNDLGIAIKKGNESDIDPFVFTGSVIKVGENNYRIFYTAHTPYDNTYGKYLECITSANSTNLKEWIKDHKNSFYSNNQYNKGDFRDPFVFFNEDEHKYWMLLCARPNQGDNIRKGETIVYASTDLDNWVFEKILYSPKQFFAHECPDMFKIGEWWYLIFSEYSDKNLVHYRKSKSPNGPWAKPKDDIFDGRAYYAAKSASNGRNRYLFGWVPTRDGNSDKGTWQWGGNLVCHQIYQDKKGDLKTKMPLSIYKFFKTPIKQETEIKLDTPYSTKTFQISNDTSKCYLFEADINASKGSSQFGILINTNNEEKNTYGFIFDLDMGNISINYFPNFPQNLFNAFQLQRSIKGTKFHVELIRDNDIVVCYVNKKIALSCRLCSIEQDNLSIFANCAIVTFSNLSVKSTISSISSTILV